MTLQTWNKYEEMLFSASRMNAEFPSLNTQGMQVVSDEIDLDYTRGNIKLAEKTALTTALNSIYAGD